MNFIQIFLTVCLFIKINGIIKEKDYNYEFSFFQKINIPYQLMPELKKVFVSDQSLYAVTKLAVANWSDIINNSNSNFSITHGPPIPDRPHFIQLLNISENDKESVTGFKQLSNIYFSQITSAKPYPVYILANHVLMALIDLEFSNIQFCYTSKIDRINYRYYYMLIVKKETCPYLYD